MPFYNPKKKVSAPVDISGWVKDEESSESGPSSYTSLPRSSMHARDTLEPGPSTTSVPYDAYSTIKVSDHDKDAFYKLDSKKIRLCIQRLVEEINWDWFRDHLLRFTPPADDDIGDAVSNAWETLEMLYDEYYKAKARNLDIMLSLPAHPADGGVLTYGQTLVHFMVQVFTGWETAGLEADARQVEILARILSKRDFMNYVKEWCRKNGYKYPGGTGQFENRVRRCKMF
ncbi:hypothetical protein EG329_002886 [Mollisiaceae sp. DMI_Dod_QoI]|nr:hypothetical protein EG329_002886 [Helotiales sp. DMI_Dod_QoI]